MDNALRSIRHWIFDMDGTLTRPIHDFEAIRAELGLPIGKPILESIEALPQGEAARLKAHLYDLECTLARQAQPQPGVDGLLQFLSQRGDHLAILTRNDRQLAHITLAAAGLSAYFPDAWILGRECCPPKPDPTGVFQLLDVWQAEKRASAMIGDYYYDLQCGRNAQVTTVHFTGDTTQLWPDLTDHVVNDFSVLLAALR